ncbi:hypothetical protein ACTGZQ_11000 [Streptococcus suis]|nr:hypothetical protein [Streptococcus suis]
MSSEIDAALRRSISSLENKKAKYVRVKNAISNNHLNTRRDLSNLKEYIDHCNQLIEIIDGEAGYAYLSNFRSKLQEDKATLKEYYSYCKDANRSFMNLYDELKTEISSLDRRISSKKSEYNDGKPIWEWIW